jgi:uncharacterized protein
VLRTATLFQFALLALFAFVSAAAGERVPLAIGGHQVTVEIVDTPETRAQGLMFRERLDADHGMLFVFPTDQQLGFWMKNTLVPLSIAFLDRNYGILNIADMEPLSERVHASAGAARYALELEQGWFARHGVGAGDRIPDIDRLLFGRPPAR